VDAGRLHPQVLSILIGLVGGADSPAARRMAAYCLRELAPDLPEAAQALLAATRDANPHVRRAALTAMAALVEPPRAVLERLAEVRDGDADPAARRIAGRALELLHPQQADSPGGSA
jgi:HEAT repeat protein